MKSKIKTILIYLVTAVVSFFFGLFVLDQIILPHIVGSQRLIEVPELESLTLDEAKVVAENNGLYVTVQSETYNGQVPAQRILKQDPEPGVVVKQGRRVYVMLSLGPEIVSVPHVLGLTQRQAAILIERSRLKLEEIQSKSDPQVARGRVIGINPPAGTALPQGEKVVLTVSEGVQQVKVPSVIDKDIEEAKIILAEAGLKLGEISYRFNRYIPEGRVIDQMPLERTAVEIGSRVDLVVSSSVP
ncbi:MAG TPA: PASTA domain-containing protein [archaeon]|nr:PASTA domain-containing protein [archaeon]